MIKRNYKMIGLPVVGTHRYPNKDISRELNIEEIKDGIKMEEKK
jgi:hypothetical protein